MIWIIGGTSETGELLEKIDGQVDYIVTVATYAGSEVLKGKNTMIKRLNYSDMLEFIEDRGINSIIDLSHPYAVEVSENARRASLKTNIEYIRFVREKTDVAYGDIVNVKDLSDCVTYLSQVMGTVFFTTGSKNIIDFEKIRGSNRFIYRVLPSKFSIDECVENNIDLKDIVAILGPFSTDFNKSLFKEYDVDYVVMKDSGEKGGTREKLMSCKDLGIKAIMIGREDETGIRDIEELAEMIL